MPVTETERQTTAAGRPTGDLVEAVRRLAYPGLRELDVNRVNALRQYIGVVTLAHHIGAHRILEIGAGISTAMWARLAVATGAEIVSVDASFDRMWTHVEAMPERDTIRDTVRLIEGGTVNADQLRTLYNDRGVSAVGAIPAETLAPLLDRFIGDRCPWRLWRAAFGETPPDAASISAMLLRDGRLHFPRPMLDRYAYGGSVDANIAFLEELDRAGRGAALERIAEEDPPFDLIFFDGGELSTLLEWEIMRERIRPGGLAAFHDVFFPKSIKSFVVCAAVEADPDWRIVYVDDSTMQGMVVAQRLR